VLATISFDLITISLNLATISLDLATIYLYLATIALNLATIFLDLVTISLSQKEYPGTLEAGLCFSDVNGKELRHAGARCFTLERAATWRCRRRRSCAEPSGSRCWPAD
jgi:hypothetical protein